MKQICLVNELTFIYQICKLSFMINFILTIHNYILVDGTARLSVYLGGGGGK